MLEGDSRSAYKLLNCLKKLRVCAWEVELLRKTVFELI